MKEVVLLGIISISLVIQVYAIYFLSEPSSDWLKKIIKKNYYKSTILNDQKLNIQNTIFWFYTFY